MDQQNEQNQAGIKLGLSWEQVGTKTGLSWDEVVKLFIALQEPKSMTELKQLYRWSNTTKFKAKYVRPLIENNKQLQNCKCRNLLCLSKNEKRDEICLYRCTIISKKCEIVSKLLHNSIFITAFANQ
jgi:hypothetical protein